MQQYQELFVEIIVFQQNDIVTTSPGGVDYDKDSSGGSLGWGE